MAARKAIVIGAGIAGLACAHRLRQLGVDVTVREAAPRAGGMVRTEAVAGYEVEWGPQTCILTPALEALAKELGLAIRRPGKKERARYILRDGRLVGPFGAISLRGLLRMVWGMVRAGAPAGEDESVEAYATRRFGREAFRRLFDPLVSGVFAGDPAKIVWANALGKFGKRRGATGSFEGGMGALPAALAKALGPALQLSTAVSSLPEADDVVVTIPAPAAADLLEAVDPALAAELRAIRYAPVTAVFLGYDASAFPGGPPRGFGFLAPSEAKLPILGCLYCLAPEGKVALRAMMRGVPPEAEAAATARGVVERLLGARGEPELVRVIRHERAIPQYEAGHAARLRRIDERRRAIPGLWLAGNAYRGVSVPDVIEDARALADAVAGQSKTS